MIEIFDMFGNLISKTYDVEIALKILNDYILVNPEWKCENSEDNEFLSENFKR